MIDERTRLLPVLILVMALAGCAVRSPNGEDIVLDSMGAFAVGGRVIGDPVTQSLSCDHGNVEYWIPAKPRRVSLLMWHSSSTRVWQNRWDGGEGYQSLFLRRGYPVYLWDGPRVGRANWGCEPIDYQPILRDQGNFLAWRFGNEYMNWHEGLQFPVDDPDAWNQATRARYNEFDTLDNALLQADAAALAVDRIGPTVALTSSAGGWRALMTRLKSDNLVGIVAYETPGFIYPVEDGYQTDPDAPYGPYAVPRETFMRLTEIPIQLVFGDNLEGTQWEPRLESARRFAAMINAYGGDAEVLVLPEAGLTGNSHIPMADLNNAAVANLLADWLARKGLAGYPAE